MVDGTVRAGIGEAPAVVRVRTIGGSAAAALLDAARGASLLVVGSRGRGGFSSMLLGSVSLHCVLHATCPVTVVPGAATGTGTSKVHTAAAAG